MSCSDSSPSNTTSTSTSARETNALAEGANSTSIACSNISTNTKGYSCNVVTTTTNNQRSNSCNTTNVTLATCQGAIKAGTALGSQAIACNTGLAETLGKANTSLASCAITANSRLASGVAACSFTFACHALDEISQEQTSSASLVSKFLCQGQSLVASEQNALACAYTQSSLQLGNYAKTLSSIAQSNDTSLASQEQAASTKWLEIGVLAAVLIVIVIALEHQG